MPEYLAPAVYIEEVPSANKPIEGASTSTAAMVGLAARGPVNIPTLVTSAGSFTRLFGGLLNPLVFTDALDSMPQAALGFFANGGSRLYVTRIVGDAATHAEADIWGEAADATAGVTLLAGAGEGEKKLVVSDATGIANGAKFVIVDGENSEAVTAGGTAAQTLIVFDNPLGTAVNDNGAVKLETTPVVGVVNGTPADMKAGGALVFQGAVTIAKGTLVRLRDKVGQGHTEYVTIAEKDTGKIDQSGLLYDHIAADTDVETISFTSAPVTNANGAAPAGTGALTVDDASTLNPGDLVSVVGAGGVIEYRTVASVPMVAPLLDPLSGAHPIGATLVKVTGLLRVHALYQGSWGNDLVVRATPVNLLATTTSKAANPGALTLDLNSTFGLFEGSALAIDTGSNLQVATVKSVNRATGQVTLTSALGPAGAGKDVAVVSREFNLFVDRIENNKVVQSEQFEGLALHPSHARYALKSVGGFDRDKVVATASGASELIRLSDLALKDNGDEEADAAARRQSAVLSGASFRMSGGNDDLAGIQTDPDTAFIGTPSDDPHLRTGIQAMENENSISIVAVPGQTSVGIQNALLEHCEKMRYRFAVIEPPAGAKVAEARAHRQNFDSTRGAIYYPWLDVADPVGAPGDLIRIPPSGHVMGIYARTDVARGVWKAPANEVVRGIIQLDTALTKGEQDILNPVHVNCFRDFRSVNRGLRLYGARTLSSDPEFRYVNVRRTLLFIEQSLDTGLQWAVFEPNAEPLWASVKQSVSGFLRTLWRDGGLEGTSEEEAFFVNIGYDVTMTQADIDNGRLIVVIGVAIVKPAEFVIVKISQKTREATS